MSSVPEKRHVFVAIPSLHGRINTALINFMSLLQYLSLTEQLPFVFNTQILSFTHPIEYARNCLVRTFLEQTEAEYLWFLDDDVIPTETSLEMLAVDADIVSGRCFIWQHRAGETPRYFVSAFERGETEDVTFDTVKPTSDQDVVKDIDAAGAACLLIRRRVLEDPRLRLATTYTTPEGQVKDLADEEGHAPPLFRSVYKPNGERYWGEDLDFVWRARALGYTAKVHLGAAFGHYKEVDLDQVGALYARKLEAAGAPLRG